jgi:hypothetical protein
MIRSPKQSAAACSATGLQQKHSVSQHATPAPMMCYTEAVITAQMCMCHVPVSNPSPLLIACLLACNVMWSPHVVGRAICVQ